MAEEPRKVGISVRLAGAVQYVELSEAGVTITVFAGEEHARRELGEHVIRGDVATMPDNIRCPDGYDTHIDPNGGFVLTCRQTGGCPKECHIFTRAAGESDWTDRGKSWLEREVFGGFVECGCV